jgi:BASS family bile acid:Na+ symporter
MNVFTKITLGITIAAFIASAALFIFTTPANGGIVLALAFLLLGFFFRRIPSLAGSYYTFIILSCVAAGLSKPDWFMYIYPSWFGLSGEPIKCTQLITPLIQMIMFGMGTQLTLRDFQAVAFQPKGVAIGLGLQFLVMPVSGLALATLCGLLSEQYGLTPEILAGIILVGCSPSGVASNVMSFLAKANVALSVTLSACSTLVAPFLTPLYMEFFASQFIEVHAVQMMASMLGIVIYPIIAGLLFKSVQMYGLTRRLSVTIQAIVYSFLIMALHFLFVWFDLYTCSVGVHKALLTIAYCVVAPTLASAVLRPLLTGREEKTEHFLAFLSSLAVGVAILATVIVGHDQLMKVGGVLLIVCLAHNLLGYVIGYAMARFCRLSKKDCRTISIEVGIQNSGLATSIANDMGKVGTLGLAPTIFGCFMNTTGSILAAIWRNIPCEEKNIKKNELNEDNV